MSPYRIAPVAVHDHALAVLSEWMQGYTDSSAHPQYKVTAMDGGDDSTLVFRFSPADRHSDDSGGVFAVQVQVRRIE